MFLLLYLLNNAMVKSTEREGSGLFGGGMPSVLTEGKHVPLSQLKTFTMIRTVTDYITAAARSLRTLKEPLSIGALHNYFY